MSSRSPGGGGGGDSTKNETTPNSNNNKWSYDVFLSFTGGDTRTSFTDHLYAKLTEKGIHTFRDNEELRKGDAISGQLEDAIKESKFVVFVFSKSYANSRWCLDEVAKAVKYEEMQPEKTLIPVFYDVKPADVRRPENDEGPYKAAFEKHKARYPDERIQEWKNALNIVANKSGFDVIHMEDGGNGRRYLKECQCDLLPNLEEGYASLLPNLEEGCDAIFQEEGVNV